MQSFYSCNLYIHSKTSNLAKQVRTIRMGQKSLGVKYMYRKLSEELNVYISGDIATYREQTNKMLTISYALNLQVEEEISDP